MAEQPNLVLTEVLPQPLECVEQRVELVRLGVGRTLRPPDARRVDVDDGELLLEPTHRAEIQITADAPTGRRQQHHGTVARDPVPDSMATNHDGMLPPTERFLGEGMRRPDSGLEGNSTSMSDQMARHLRLQGQGGARATEAGLSHSHRIE